MKNQFSFIITETKRHTIRIAVVSSEGEDSRSIFSENFFADLCRELLCLSSHFTKHICLMVFETDKGFLFALAKADVSGYLIRIFMRDENKYFKALFKRE